MISYRVSASQEPGHRLSGAAFLDRDVAGVEPSGDGRVRPQRSGAIHHALHRGEFRDADRHYIHLRSTEQAIQDDEAEAR